MHMGIFDIYFGNKQNHLGKKQDSTFYIFHHVKKYLHLLLNFTVIPWWLGLYH